LKSGDWELLQVKEDNIFFSTIYKMREYFLSILSTYVRDRNQFAVASAIMLGYNDYMNGDITRAYASSGALHVLSVSGLHVGIMFFMLNVLLKFMDNRGRKLEITKSVSIILFIWLYACLTGLSPSVLRSAMMFSLIQSGTLLKRHVNTFNIVFGSAVVLMLFNPFIVTEVGFRLSYLAVLGIIYLQPKIYSLWAFKNWFLDKAWMIVAVSLAAQIATFPLSLLYFHQFPNLFLISNLVVIPVSNLILFLGTGLFAVGTIP
jgi:competence protein ComEC